MKNLYLLTGETCFLSCGFLEEATLVTTRSLFADFLVGAGVSSNGPEDLVLTILFFPFTGMQTIIIKGQIKYIILKKYPVNNSIHTLRFNSSVVICESETLLLVYTNLNRC